MPRSLIVVESPTKVKTIKKYLGSDYEVRASMGHIKDLPKKTIGIDLKNHFEPEYQIIDTKKKVVAELKKAAKSISRIYLAPDPDREGEAIAWHIADVIGTKDKEVKRVLFTDLTKNTILEALRHPQDLDFNKYEAQQTRRILDRLVGYKISPLLWEKVKRGLSAGRVQSVAVRIICEREEAIRNFVQEEYWNLLATLEGSNPPAFDARLFKIDGKKAKLQNEKQTNLLIEELKKAQFAVSDIDRKEVKRHPSPPFTTSKLQQEAFRWLHFPAKKTMSVAQKLYEGIDLGEEGPVGLITYMRTDSVRVAAEVVTEARKYISDNYESAYLPAKPKAYKNSASAQDAHEAVRPSSMMYKPQDIKKYLTPDQFRLYELIWNRFIASQMNPAVFDQTIIDIQAGRCLFRVMGSIMKFLGYMILYREGKDENGGENNGNGDKQANGGDKEGSESGRSLPSLSVGDSLKLIQLKSEQKFTQPPPRFTEATLVKELEEKGIGRPSTYATILSTIQDRAYVVLEKSRFSPTELGILVTALLVKNFPHIMDIAFTAALENKLDSIEEGKKKRTDTLVEFYKTFEEELKQAKATMRNVKREETPTEFICEKCQSPMIIKWGKNGRFVACSNYPTCKNTMNIPSEDNSQGKNGGEPIDVLCEKCGLQMVIKQGRFGRFIGCSGYPGCKNTMAMTTGVPCPEEGCEGVLTEKMTKKGRVFYGCSKYPACKFATWDRPIQESCPNCGAKFLVGKTTQKGTVQKICLNKVCGFKSEA
ncbi:MAG: type I DNA topoisomerase [Syntrophales bacterium]|jgi:DNA topoisomerase-1